MITGLFRRQGTRVLGSLGTLGNAGYLFVIGKEKFPNKMLRLFLLAKSQGIVADVTVIRQTSMSNGPARSRLRT